MRDAADVFLWPPKHGGINVGWSARTYIPQLCADTELRLEDLPGVIDNRERERERERESQRNPC